MIQCKGTTREQKRDLELNNQVPMAEGHAYGKSKRKLI